MPESLKQASDNMVQIEEVTDAVESKDAKPPVKLPDTDSDAAAAGSDDAK